jgi:transcriptional regulator with XRE-family HTH domain
MNKFNERLKFAMDMRGVTPSMMGRDLGVSRGRISSLLIGRINAPRKDLPAISRYLSISEIWLLNGDGRMDGCNFFSYDLFRGELVKSDQPIRLGELNIKVDQVFVNPLKLEGFSDNTAFVLSPKKKSDGLYLLYKNDKYFLGHRTENIINTNWVHLGYSETHEQSEISFIGCVDYFFMGWEA